MPAHDFDKLLVVSPNADSLGCVFDYAERALGVRIAYVARGADADELDRIVHHHAAIVDLHLPDMPGIRCAARLRARRRVPVILFGESPTLTDALDALQMGAVDLLESPIDPARAIQSLMRCFGDEVELIRAHRRIDRLRTVLRRVLKDRYGLNMRMELISRDLVGAQRRLFHRVLAMENGAGVDL